MEYLHVTYLLLQILEQRIVVTQHGMEWLGSKAEVMGLMLGILLARTMHLQHIFRYGSLPSILGEMNQGSSA